MSDEPVTHWELDRVLTDIDRRIGRLDRWTELHDEQQLKQTTQKARDKSDGRRWKWEQIWAAVGAVLVLAGLFLESRGR